MAGQLPYSDAFVIKPHEGRSLRARFSAASVRARLLIVIASLVALASFAIGITYLTTEGERVQVETSSQTLTELLQLTAGWAHAIHEQGAAVDDYILWRDPADVVRYRAAVEDEVRIAERIRDASAEFPEVVASVDQVSTGSSGWRSSFAEPVIAAVDHGSQADVQALHESAGGEFEVTLSGLDIVSSSIEQADASLAIE